MQTGPRPGGPSHKTDCSVATIAISPHSLLLLAAAAHRAGSPRAGLVPSRDIHRREQLRIAVADFKSASADPATTSRQSAPSTTTLYTDLANAGIFDIVSKSLTPAVRTRQSSPRFSSRSGPPHPPTPRWSPSATLGVRAARLTVNGFLFDAKNPQYPQVFAKQYNEDASDDSARQIAHRFADEIIFRLGGGITGIAETKIYYVKIRPAPTKRSGRWTTTAPTSTPITHLGTISLSPRISPDNSRIAFSSLGRKTAFRSACTLCCWTAWSTSRTPAAPTSRLHGRPTASSSPTPPRAPAIPRSGSPTPTAPRPPHHQLPRS